MSPDPHGARPRRDVGIGPHRRRRRRALKAFVLRKGGHTYCFCYPSEHEHAAIRAAAACEELEAIDVVALACYLGHDPRVLGLGET